METRAGYTLVELLLVLSLSALLAGAAASSLARWRDAAAVRAAREELAGALAWTRLTALTHGGASLRVDPASARIRVVTARGPARPEVDLAARFGVTLEAGRGDPFELRYDGLGLGRGTSRTFTLRRGTRRAGLTVSWYGRYRRW